MRRTVVNTTVTLQVPATPGHLAILRTTIGGIAARDRFTLDQVDDLRMAVEEAAVQLLRQAGDDRLEMTVEPTEQGLEVRLSVAAGSGDGAVLDEDSFSWTILQALADSLEAWRSDGRAVVVLTKHRLEEGQ